ncbi:hypothetical protein SISSUDRAFT_395537 [Sistotremastrum suecicum HHB10207 ss-3]|uniref:Isomerase YbhE n=1 Tax=Sistotremastrum suecicum HHB10207 ss-3 TaxID=1314776 RepID=A0A165YV14_9AGAM|nr:hypothetical protein SISSUDRAFT_395537 [Sistotremastrum suecicum HHB10207 ss-3]
MKSFVASLSACVIAGQLAAASFTPICHEPDSHPAIGAIYFMTNDGTANKVIAHEIQPDGTVVFGKTAWIGGKGLHGNDAPAATGPDPLFAQGALQVSGNHLFTINPGSNTASMFEIDDRDPTKLRLIGVPVNTGGEFPMAITASPKTNHVCVANGGKVNGVQCFTADPEQGLLPIQNSQRLLKLPLTTPPVGPPGTVSNIQFSGDGSKLFASVKGVPPKPGFIATWDVNQDGSLSQNFKSSTPAKGGMLPFSITPIPGKNAVLNTDAGVGFSVFDFSRGDVASSTVIPIKGQKATCWSAYSSKTGTFFLTDVGTATVTEVKVDQNLRGSIVKQYPLGAGTATVDNGIATVNGKDYLYVLQANITSVNVMSLKAPGQAKTIQTFNFAADAKKAGITVDRNNLQGMAVYTKF